MNCAAWPSWRTVCRNRASRGWPRLSHERHLASLSSSWTAERPPSSLLLAHFLPCSLVLARGARPRPPWLGQLSSLPPCGSAPLTLFSPNRPRLRVPRATPCVSRHFPSCLHHRALLPPVPGRPSSPARTARPCRATVVRAVATHRSAWVPWCSATTPPLPTHLLRRAPMHPKLQSHVRDLAQQFNISEGLNYKSRDSVE